MSVVIDTTAIFDSSENQYVATFNCPIDSSEWKYYPEADEGIGKLVPGCYHVYLLLRISYNPSTKEVQIEFG